MSDPKVDRELAHAHGLSDQEWQRKVIFQQRNFRIFNGYKH